MYCIVSKIQSSIRDYNGKFQVKSERELYLFLKIPVKVAALTRSTETSTHLDE